MEAAAQYLDTLVTNNTAGTAAEWVLPELPRFWEMSAHAAEQADAHTYIVPDESMVPTAPQIPVMHPKVLAKKGVKRRITGKSVDPGVGNPHPEPEERSIRAVRAKPPMVKGKKKARLARPPDLQDERLGCKKCRHSKRGCAHCRKKQGMVITDGQWVWPIALASIEGEVAIVEAPREGADTPLHLPSDASDFVE